MRDKGNSAILSGMFKLSLFSASLFSAVAIGFLATGSSMLKGDTVADGTLHDDESVAPLAVHRAAPVDVSDSVSPVSTVSSESLTPLIRDQASSSAAATTDDYLGQSEMSAVNGTQRPPSNRPGWEGETTAELRVAPSATRQTQVRRVEAAEATQQSPAPDRRVKTDPNPTFLIGVYR